MEKEFQYGDKVISLGYLSHVGVRHRAIGTVWCTYTTKPPMYEVTFCNDEGKELDITMYSDELEEASNDSIESEAH